MEESQGIRYLRYELKLKELKEVQKDNKEVDWFACLQANKSNLSANSEDFSNFFKDNSQLVSLPNKQCVEKVDDKKSRKRIDFQPLVTPCPARNESNWHSKTLVENNDDFFNINSNKLSNFIQFFDEHCRSDSRQCGNTKDFLAAYWSKDEHLLGKKNKNW